MVHCYRFSHTVMCKSRQRQACVTLTCMVFCKQLLTSKNAAFGGGAARLGREIGDDKDDYCG